MRKNFQFIVDRIIREEVNPGHEQDGDLHTDPNDPGGTTKFGFAQRYNSDIDVSSLTRSQAEERYFLKYWNFIHGDNRPTGTDLVVMNFAVNAGVERANHFADKTVQIINKKFNEWEWVATFGAPLWIEYFIDEFTKLIKEFYNMRPQKSKDVYLKDWIFRTNRIARYARLMLMAELTGKSIEILDKTKEIPDVIKGRD